MAESTRQWPSGQRWRLASRNALTAARTWVPAAAAVGVAAGGWDGNISEWATREAPVFGSAERAYSASDDLRTATHLGMIATALAVPAEDRRWRERIERLFWEHAGVVGTSVATRGLKTAVGRERPDGSDDLSFPSGHSSRAFAYSAMTARNLHSTNLGRAGRIGLNAGLTSLAAATAWSRVEGGAHYPSDMLAGAALGSFVSVLVHDAFIGREGSTVVLLQIDRRRSTLSIRRRF